MNVKRKSNVDQDKEFYRECVGLAKDLAVAVIERYRIPTVESDQRTKIENASFSYHLTSGREVMLFVEIDGDLGGVGMSFNLSKASYDIVCVVRSLFSNSRGPSMLEEEIKEQLAAAGIDMWTLLRIESDNDLEGSIRQNCEMILELFLTSLPFFAQSSLIHTLDRSRIAWSLNYLRPAFSDYWSDLGLPRGWSLISQKRIDELREEDWHHRNWFVGERRRSRLTDDVLLGKANELLPRYRIFKAQYLEKKTAFFAKSRRATKTAWKKQWFDFARDSFPDLSAVAGDALMGNEELNPCELRNIHLAHVYGYDVEYLRRKLRLARKKRKEVGE